MRQQQRLRKTLRGGARIVRKAPRPGPAVCSPLAQTRRNGRACVPKDILQRIAGNTVRRRTSQTGGQASEEGLVKTLSKNLGCKRGDSRCIIEKAPLPEKEKKELLSTWFRPPVPSDWKGNMKMWLSSEDIETVMKQYEKAYSHFRFLGVVPIDFTAPDPYVNDDKKCMNQQFCTVNLKEEREKGRKILGAVFNMDPHFKDGSHWIALAVDLEHNCVCYFDSYGMRPPAQVSRYMRYLLLQDPKLKLQRNGRRFQFSHSECGTYCIYFLIRLIMGESFSTFSKKPIPDKYMFEFRKILWDANAKSDKPAREVSEELKRKMALGLDRPGA
jgi:hypothetical protein